MRDDDDFEVTLRKHRHAAHKRRRDGCLDRVVDLVIAVIVAAALVLIMRLAS